MTHTTVCSRIEDPYFDWLCGKVWITPYKYRYIEMARILYSIKWRNDGIEMDENRANDGLSLRDEYLKKHDGPAIYGPCNMFEVLVALAKRMSFIMSNEHEPHLIAKYFWAIITNLGLERCSDDNWISVNGEFRVEEAMNRVLDRTYDANGSGGLFPLQRIRADQRHMEIWYQMQCWLTEHAENLLE